MRKLIRCLSLAMFAVLFTTSSSALALGSGGGSRRATNRARVNGQNQQGALNRGSRNTKVRVARVQTRQASTTPRGTTRNYALMRGRYVVQGEALENLQVALNEAFAPVGGDYSIADTRNAMKFAAGLIDRIQTGAVRDSDLTFIVPDSAEGPTEPGVTRIRFLHNPGVAGDTVFAVRTDRIGRNKWSIRNVSLESANNTRSTFVYGNTAMRQLRATLGSNPRNGNVTQAQLRTTSQFIKGLITRIADNQITQEDESYIVPQEDVPGRNNMYSTEVVFRVGGQHIRVIASREVAGSSNWSIDSIHPAD